MTAAHRNGFFELIDAALAMCLVAGCASATTTGGSGPRGPTADEHRQMATIEQDRANELTRWPDTRHGGADTDIQQRLTTGAWFGSWDTAAEHDRLARIHRSEAAQLEAEYQAACGDTPVEIVRVSPLQRYGIGGNPIAEGARILLSPQAGSPDQLLAAMRCHRAWMRLGRTDMDDCPLDLPGLKVSARGDAEGIELTLTISPERIGELQRRAAHDLEAAQRRSSPKPVH